MSKDKKIRNRLNKLFDGLQLTEETEATPQAEQAKPAPTSPVQSSQKPKKPVYTGALSPSAADSWQKRNAAESSAAGNFISIPFQAGDIWNAIQLEQDNSRRWNDNEQNLVRQVADQLGLALNNARLFEETKKSAQLMAAVAEIATRISTVLDLQTLLETAVNLTQQHFDLYHAHIFLMDDDSKSLVLKACGWKDGHPHDGPEYNQRIEVDKQVSIVARTARTKLPVVLNDVYSDPNWLANPMLPDTKSEIAVAVVSGEKVLGVLNVHSDELNHFTNADLSIMTTLAAQIGSAIQNALLFSETQRYAEELQEAEFKYRSIFENSTEGIFQTTFDGHYLSANPALAKIYGYETPDELIQSIRDISHELYVETHRREEFIQVMEQQDVVYQFESAIYRKDGNIIWISENARAVRDDEGNLLFYEGAVKDITELKRAEEALRRQNEYLATAAEVSRLISSTLDLPTLFERTVNLIQSRFKYYHVAVFTVDEAGFNATLREATGEAGSEMKRNQHFLPVGSKSIIGHVTGNGETLVANNTSIDLVHRPNPLLPDTLAEAGIPLKIGSRVIGALDIQSTMANSFHPEDIAVLQTLADQIAVAIDNARSYELAQKAVTEIRELDRIKSQFLANMSHELRTPLNSIIGFSRVILKGIDGPISDQQQQDLTAIYNSGQHLLGLINDILDLSKIEAGKMDLSVEEMNIADTINSVMSTAAGLVKDKSVKLKHDIPPNLPTIRADPMRIRQVLINLISNAAKFTDEGSITVSAEPHISPTGYAELMISVTDTGPGISQEDQAKLFQAFSQVDSSPTRKTGGTGLGLSICQRLVDMHNGRIGVRSAVGKGSTFYFTIPQFHQPPTDAVPGQGKVILCIDDDQQVIGLYDRYLKPQGYQVIPVTNPAAARDAIRRMKPYAVTLDIMMPEIDGWSLLETLKADPETRSTPVIICSIVEEEEKGFSLGASDYLVKPILEEDLLNALNRLNGDGTIKEVLIIDDSADDLRLIEKMLAENSQFKPLLAEGGERGWDMIINGHPSAIILDLFMPDLNGFTILERLRTTSELRDIPVVVVSGVDLTPDQKKQLDNLGKHLLQKGMLNEQDLFATLMKALKRLEVR